MAERPAQDRTEEATPRRIEEAREKGDVAKSQEIPSAALLLTVVIFFYYNGESFIRNMANFFRDIYASIATINLTVETVPELTRLVFSRGLLIAGPPMMVALIMGLLVNYLQVGVIFAPKAINPRWSRVSPAAGLKRIFSSKGLVELIKGVFKLTVVGTILYIYLSDRVKDYPFLTYMTPMQIIGTLATDLFKIGLFVGIAFVVMAAADLVFQKWDYKRQMRMSKQEVKDETRQQEISPELRARIKTIQREMSRNRMMSAVPNATVVVTNPVHVAIALAYQNDSDSEAPLVVAKGQRKIAERIKEIARENGVPIKESPLLARALFKSCEVGDEIPYDYYRTVAEILAEIFWDEHGNA